ncbi:branched-chain amino acid ABC transporter permease [Neoroseomonas oryzicola]|uniref:Branched-chain amino acid ABC transporter permease n=1 Tax=Neoroseomonas oryzicola TaxID=535904 RepID=A0A9X9WK83_9PROT|nr:branched-chain amino acid ABC transporter permease [Neoroseomonas oryzicola]MBR0660743.1 branched-chain amino acid ABC transporter permease [Neoroseomonas oryzicola]NKE20267.1 branched-chain amino acid ABC transporter permease [Neoroseomonas oryzicola]
MRKIEPLLAILLAGAMIAAAIAAPWLRFVLTIALAKGIAVMGILLLLRAGQVSFGHALYIAFGAYTVAFLAPRFGDAMILLPLAAVGAGALGLVIGLFVTRYRQIFFGMLNLAMSMVFYSLLEKLYAITKGSDGIRVEIMPVAGQALDRITYEWTIFGIALGLAFVLGLLLRLYLASPMGEALAGIKTRETRLEFMGVPARGVLLSAYVMSAVLGGIGGALIAMTSRHVTPLLAYWTSSGELVFIAILGGAGGVLGPFLGAAGYELVRVYAAASFADAWQMILGAVLLLVILFAPGGLWGMAARAIGGRGR